ncbi:MAG: anti-sigma factor [Candidatus Acidiferrales bacterium]
MEPHDRFLELCALSTSDELSEEEQKALHTHLAECAECRQALSEFEAAAGFGVPLLHSALSTPGSSASQPIPLEDEKETSPSTVHGCGADGTERIPLTRAGETSLTPRNGRRRLQVNWNYVWMPFAAAIVLTAALAIYSYQVGRRRALEADRARSNVADTRVEALEQRMSDLGHEHEAMKVQLADRDHMIADLKRQMAAESAALSEAKSVQTALERNLEQTLQGQAADKKQVAQEQSNLSQKLTAAQTSLAKTQTELASLQQQRAQGQARSESLEAQIRDLHGQIHDREQALDKEEELLAHDRDIRELMGARELYIAEVYDVAKDGQTKKPYGRVFYTRGKSLVFYAYDLDQQNGLKRASTFQAWGSRGVDRQQATSLGVFYEDSISKKRWVLKSDDPKKLEQIDAVFVTVEPNGGSLRPSGKPLLFAYLKIEPNHP